MLKTIIYREFLSNIITFRFLMGLLVCVGLVGTNTIELLRDHEQKVEVYHRNQRQRLEYFREMVALSDMGSRRFVQIRKSPQLLSLLNEGVEPQLNDAWVVSHNRVPLLDGWQSYASKNPYLNVFPKIHLSLVFQIVISLLAFLFAYDSVAGEREQGTLALTLSNSIPRSKLLLGKYLGGMLSLAVPVAISLIVAVQVILFSRSVEVAAEEWIRLGLFGAVSLLYVSTFFTLGMLFSTLTRRAATSLMTAMFFWIIFVVVWPHASKYVVTQLVPVKPSDPVSFDGARRAEVKAESHLILDRHNEFMRECVRYAERLGFTTSYGGYYVQYFSGTDTDGYLAGTRTGRYTGPPEKLDEFQEWFRHREETLIQMVDELERIQWQYFTENPRRQHHIAQNAARISPAGAYANATSVLAGTDLGAHLYFLDLGRQYRAELIQYMRDRDAFGSAIWYSVADFTKEHLDSIPTFRYRPEPLVSQLSRLVADVLILITLNAMFFFLTFAAFLRCDAR
jgi:ABC-type transport system involved in multi-copper enzyme maturation permease subunit